MTILSQLVNHAHPKSGVPKIGIARHHILGASGEKPKSFQVEHGCPAAIA
ncbi:MAG: hypothetical protein NW224_12375 [Leptolyngbyaceae cyanobacterium bins.302]|nr:hypothetical protein [Leptolyngbyaceae cyanobacterium bins.302]